MEIQNFSYQLPDGRQLFDQLSVTFDSGKINLLLGVNGVGKTTLLDLISGVSEQRNLPFVGFPPMGRIAYQMQGAPFTGTATVSEAIGMMVDLDQPNGHFQETQLPASLQEIAHSHFRDLSGGQRRLVILEGICRLNRDLYLFDEPESGLDVKVAVSAMERISRLTTQGKTVIMTTHQFHNLPTDRVKIQVLAKKHLAFCGTPSELMAETGTSSMEAAYLKMDA
ncbi:ATP-binding cassette domain-containing protein [Levilactobacillus tujiorum]|uniref:AAA family ATPase n=1 Tax=Levilactobacillus tujiorum TaxID=2912243 RepID=A0ABX1L383_9LACO|nr:AAA family ATPase [Levilactobacillus tujiorum]MCH5464510.1 AAA family ATPase [Levilactobacillus tujiorum]NLR12885.1 AAA family ATPase [Lactobacillus sp. HBUAS51387]NLR29490.1 AAA family ATPase [Levilactobacillus tujiorum]